MIVVAHIDNQEIVLSALELEDKYLILTPSGSLVSSFVSENNKLDFMINGTEVKCSAFVNDNLEDVEKIFNLFNEHNTNYFKELTSDLVVLECSK